MKKTFIRGLAVLLSTVLLGAAILIAASAAAPVDITDKFTDLNFRAAVYEQINKSDPESIYAADVAGILTLRYTQDRNIHSLAGLEYFSGLQDLNCAFNQLTALPALPVGLTTLNCSGNQLASLPELPSGLKSLGCGGNRLASLPVLPSGLEFLHCSNGQLVSLPVLPSSLTELYCQDNQLATLPTLPAGLQYLICFGNQLENIDVTGLSSLEYINCINNYLPDKSAVKGFAGIWDNASYFFDPQNSTTPLTPPAPKPKTIFNTDYKSSFGNWLMFIFLFGFIWMWF